MSRLYERLTGALHAIYDRRVFDPPILDARLRFADQSRFVAAWAELRDEALKLAEDLSRIPRFHELMAEQADISANDQRDWRMFVLKAYGVDIKSNQARCPCLAALLQECPEVISATLSFLAPYKHIPEHRGPFRGVLRFYLGLSVPCDKRGRPDTELLIDGSSFRIGDGECLLWDDTYPHEVRHDSARPRVALLLDVRRRSLPPGLTLLSGALIRLAGWSVRWRRLARHDPFAPVQATSRRGNTQFGRAKWQV